jgi:hypothetical protein
MSVKFCKGISEEQFIKMLDERKNNKSMRNIIFGQDIVSLNTIGSLYANGDIVVHDDKNKRYYMHVSEIMKFDSDFNSVKFKIVKKRVREYLEVI